MELAALKLELRMEPVIQELDLRAGHIVPGPGPPPARSKSAQA